MELIVSTLLTTYNNDFLILMNNDLHCYCWEIGHRNSHIIAIIKPERSHRMPERFMSISLLRHPRKLFEGLILN